MKSYMIVIIIGTSLTVHAETSSEFRNAIRNGAVGKYVYRVVDDEGVPVSNAAAHVWFKSYGRPQDKADWIIETDTNGMFAAEHRFNEKFSVGIDKEGYYHTHDEVNYFGMASTIVVDGKWQPYGETRTVVLKKIRNPWGVKVLTGEQCHRRIPKFDEWIGFDFEQGDWSWPYGTGKYKDILVRFKSSVRKRQVDFTHVMEVSFTNNQYAGFYQMKKDMASDLVSDYTANSNALYKTDLVYVQEKLEKTPRRWDFLDKDSYLVFRTRTRIDEDGKLVGAHYGKIYGYWCSDDEEMTFCGGCFNITENDPNIEGDQTLLYKIKNYKAAK